MGWTCTYKEPGVSMTQWFVERGVLRWSGESPYAYKVLDSAMVRFVHYAAIEKTAKATGQRVVFATVILTKSFRKGADGHNFCWKDMGESEGPCEDRCPARILDLLSPTDSEYANGWRQRCRDRIALDRAMPSLEPGIRVHFSTPVQFSSGAVSDLVIDRTDRANVICTSQEAPGNRYKLPRRWIKDRHAKGTLKFDAPAVSTTSRQGTADLFTPDARAA